ncbi:MAG: DUF2726 domain-containing protein [Gammaproteobacteria bacterium]
MELFVTVFIVFALLAIARIYFTVNKPTNSSSTKSPILHKKREYLCTENEKKFFYALQEALKGKYFVHCQTSLIALVEPIEFKHKSKAWSKRMDFVITDKSTRVLAVIELDDSTHKQKKRIARDEYVNDVLNPHHPLIRIPSRKFYDPKEMLKLIEEKLNFPLLSAVTSNVVNE